jgi:hypothetical protein
VFGKHSGAAAVQAVLEAHAPQLERHGIRVDERLAERVLDRVKQLREEQITTRQSADAIRDFYRHYGNLGVSEVAVVELALEASRQTNGRAVI